jgi:hypothetical protein
MLSWCDRHGIGYIVGLARNKPLQRMIEQDIAEVGQRAVIAKLEVTPQARNPRFVVTNLNGDAQTLYDQVYCARGDMENRIKEQQLGLFADRTSTHCWWTNQFRLLLSSLALRGTELANAQVSRLRLKLFRVGAVVCRNTRRVRFLLSSAFPYPTLFLTVAERLAPA